MHRNTHKAPQNKSWTTGSMCLSGVCGLIGSIVKDILSRGFMTVSVFQFLFVDNSDSSDRNLKVWSESNVKGSWRKKQTLFYSPVCSIFLLPGISGGFSFPEDNCHKFYQNSGSNLGLYCCIIFWIVKQISRSINWHSLKIDLWVILHRESSTNVIPF